MTDALRPPAHVEPFVRVLGIEGAVRFLMEFGGAELSWHASPRRSRVVEVFGAETATELARVCADLPRRVPTAKPWIARVLKSRGLSVAEISRRLHTTDVTVRRYLRDDPGPAADPRQPSLF